MLKGISIILILLLDRDAEDEKEYKKEMAEKFKPLLTWMKDQAGDVVRDGEILSAPFYVCCGLTLMRPTVVISNRLVTSPVAVVADMYGLTANVEKLMSKFRHCP